MTQKVTNANSYPSLYYAKHMAPGLAGYENETIFLDVDAVKAMIPSFVGKPVVVQHKDITLNNLEIRDGTVIESFYNELDGALWTKMLIESDAAKDAIKKGWSVSNCYQPTQWGSGGKHHNVDYNRQIKNGEFQHLAIVQNPRYEEAGIYTPEEFKNYQEDQKKKHLQNSMENKTMIKFFKNEKKEVTSIEDDTLIQLENGKEMPLKDILNAVKKNDEAEEKEKKEKDEKENKKNALDMDSEIQVGDAKMPIKDLLAKYNALTKKNEMSEEECKKKKMKEEEEEEDKKNKKNALDAENKTQNFDPLLNAANKNGQVIENAIDTGTDKLARGKSRYGSAKK